MKKRLKWIIPLCIALAIAVGIGILALRYRASGAVLHNSVGSGRDGTYLIQIREKGARKLKLSDEKASEPVFSPSGRYFAVTLWEDHESSCVLYDTLAPRKPILHVPDYLSAFRPLDDGSLLYLRNDTIFLAKGEETTALARNIARMDTLSGDGSAVYCFRQVVDDRLDLCLLSLDGTLTTLMEDMDKNALQVVPGPDGQDIVICARRVSYETPAYSLVNDPLAVADVRSTDEDAAFRNGLREQLRQQTIPETLYTVWRIAGGKQALLVEGALAYYCDPVTGMVIYKPGRAFADAVDISSLREASIPACKTWYCTANGTRTALTELDGAEAITVQFPGDGHVLLHANNATLYVRRWDGNALSPADTVGGVSSFAPVLDEDGRLRIYYPMNGQLLCLSQGQKQVLCDGIYDFWVPGRRLPDGTVEMIDDMVYVRHYARDDSLRGGKKPPVTLSQMIHWPPSELYLLQRGEKELLVTMGDVYFLPDCALPDGSLVFLSAGTWRVTGPTRQEKLSVAADWYTLGTGSGKTVLLP